MKKKLKVVFASLLTLCLFSCGEASTSSSAAKTSTDVVSTSSVVPASESEAPAASSLVPESVPVSEESASVPVSEDPASVPEASSAEESSEEVSSEEASSEASSEESSSVEDVGWDEDLTELMNTYLNNNVIPYIDLGDGTYGSYHSPSYYDNDAYLTVYGMDEFTDALLTSFENTYSAAGWTVTVGTDSVTATLESEHLTVTLKADAAGYATLVATYDEPYDNTTITAWPAEISAMFDTDFPGCNIPFIYLGTTNMSYSGYSDEICITGGKWNDQVTTDAATVLEDDDWTCGETTDSWGDTIWAATKDFGNYSVTITLESYYGHIYCEITWLESFNPDNADGDWSDTVKTYFNNNLDGHALPYFYMGTNNPNVEDYYSGELDMYSMGEWSDEVFDLADAAFTADNWEVSTKKSSYYGTYHEYTKDFDDGHTLTVQIYDYSDYGYGIGVVIKMKNTFSVPDDVTDWTDTINNYFDTNFDGHKLPFFYCGSSSPSCYYYDNEMEIYDYNGGTWDDQIVDLAIAALQADTNATWTYTKGTDSYGYAKLTATGTFDDGHILEVTIAYSYWYESAMITVELKDTFDPTSCSDWTDDTKTAMTTDLGHELPYVYLGSADPSVYYTGVRFEVTGGDYNSQILDLAETAYAEWDYEIVTASDYNGGVNFTTGSDMFKATKTFDDGCTITVCIGKSYYGESYFEAVVDHAYIVDDTVTAWPSNVESMFTSKCDGCDIPFFYMGSDTLDIMDYTSYYGYFYVYAEDVGYSSGMVDAFEDALDTATGWTYTESTDSYGFTRVTATKNFDNGTKITLTFSYNSYYGATLSVTPGTVFVVPDTATDWSDDMKTAMTTYLNGHTIPFFYIGSEDPEVYTSYYNYYGYYSVYSDGEWDEQIVDLAKTAFENDNADGDWTIVTATDSYGYTTLRATKNYDDGKTVSVRICYSSSYGCYMTVSCYDTYEIPADATEWNEDFTDACNDYLDGHEIPYFYLGTLDPEVDTYYFDYYGEIEVYGENYDDQMFLDAKETLETEGWAVTMTRDSSTYYTLTASYTYDDGCTITINLSYSSYSGVYMIITYSAAE